MNTCTIKSCRTTIEVKFRALAAQGIMNAIEHAIDGADDDFAAATIGICEGIANAFATLVSPMTPMQQKRLLAILTKHPQTQQSAPQFRAGMKAMLKALGFARASKPF